METTKKEVKYIRWVAPIHPFKKVFVDGCSKGNPGPAAAVGVLRNCNGEWIMGFVNNLGITQNFAAEFGAIYHGLSMAWDLGYRHLILESDSKTCLSCITQAVPSTHPKELT